MTLFHKNIKKEKILSIDLITRNVKRSAVSSTKSIEANEAWHPFIQITNVHGRVVGRSKVLPDNNNNNSCHHDADEDYVVYPTMKLSWDDLSSMSPPVPSPSSSLRSSSTLSTKKWIKHDDETREESSSSSSSMVETQPLLIAIYAFNREGRYLLFGKTRTTLRDILDKTNQLKRGALRHLHDAVPSFVVDKSRTDIDRFPPDDAPSRGFLYVKRVKVSHGMPDTLSQIQFSGKKKDYGKIPYLPRVRTPKGLPAWEEANTCSGNGNIPWNARQPGSGLGGSQDETDIISDSSSSSPSSSSSSSTTNESEENREGSFDGSSDRDTVGYCNTRRNLRTQEANAQRLLEETKRMCQSGVYVNVQIVKRLAKQLEHEKRAQQQRMAGRRDRQ